jgi:hypothetical protein
MSAQPRSGFVRARVIEASSVNFSATTRAFSPSRELLRVGDILYIPHSEVRMGPVKSVRGSFYKNVRRFRTTPYGEREDQLDVPDSCLQLEKGAFAQVQASPHQDSQVLEQQKQQQEDRDAELARLSAKSEYSHPSSSLPGQKPLAPISTSKPEIHTCPVCGQERSKDLIQIHVDTCLRLQEGRERTAAANPPLVHTPQRPQEGVFSSVIGGAASLGSSIIGAIRPSSATSDRECRFCHKYLDSVEAMHVHIVTHHETELAREEEMTSDVHPPPHVPFNFGLESVPGVAAEDSNTTASSAAGDSAAARRYVGAMRGIQGANNSCYVDATLFAMFALNASFDGVLVSRGPPATTAAAAANALRVHLRTCIVNELRSRGFVPFGPVEILRRMMSTLGFEGNDFSKDDVRERDAEEVFGFLMQSLEIPSLIRLCHQPEAFSSGSPQLTKKPAAAEAPSWDVHSIQLMLCDARLAASPGGVNRTATTQELLNETLAGLGSTVCAPSGAPKNLVLIVPRHSAKERVLSAVIPSFEVKLPLHVHSRKAVSSIEPAVYELHGMCTIDESHYVSYARDVAQRDSGLREWYAFDSMAEKIGAVTVPVVRRADLSWLDSDDILAEQIRGGEASAVDAQPDLKRVLSDVSLCFYARVSPDPVANGT